MMSYADLIYYFYMLPVFFKSIYPERTMMYLESKLKKFNIVNRALLMNYNVMYKVYL